MKDNPITIGVEISGTKPALFCRLAGTDKKTLADMEANPEKRMYLDRENRIYLPANNLLSFFCAQNGKSCVNYWGPQGRTEAAKRRELADNFLAFVTVEPEEILFLRRGKPIKFTGLDRKTHRDKKAGVYLPQLPAPRVVSKGQSIPQACTRPALELPWSLRFKILIRPNATRIDANMVEGFLEAGGPTIGLLNFRPRYGTFELSRFDVRKKR